MRNLLTKLLLAFTFLLFLGCAGFRIPGSQVRILDLRVESERVAVNSGCVSLKDLNSLATRLEEQHLRFVRTKDEEEALKADTSVFQLGKGCWDSVSQLSVGEIKQELFGDLQVVPNPDRLRDLGGMEFRFQDVSTQTGIEPSLHIRKRKRGPERRMVLVYKLENQKVIHFNYSGTNDVDAHTRRWPIREVFNILLDVGTAAGSEMIAP